MTTEKQQTPLQKLIAKFKAQLGEVHEQSEYREVLEYAIGEVESLLPEEKQMFRDTIHAGIQPDISDESCDRYFNDTYQQ